MEKVKVLQQARELIRNAWCRGFYAVDSKHKAVKPTDPRACRFCALGAVSRVAGKSEVMDAQEFWKYLDKAAAEKGYDYTVTFNDSKKNKRDVIKLFDRAIELAFRDQV